MGRVIVFGMDGADPDLLYPWARDGYLPNLARLLKSGAHGRLRSTIHPLTPQAWTSMITGVNPGRHGIFDFGRRRTGSYAIDLVTSADRLFPTLFEYLPEPLTCGVVNVPPEFPVPRVRGFAVGGMHTPSLDSPGAFSPADLAPDLEGYVIDVMAHWYDDRASFISDVHAMLKARHATCLRLLEKKHPDVFFAVYVELDRVQHALWGEMTEAHRKEPGRHGGDGDEIFRIARALDDCLGDYLALLRADDHLLLVSDHGFGHLSGDVYPNVRLAEQGYLLFDPAKVRAKKFDADGTEPADPKHGWHRKLFSAQPEPLPASDEMIRAGHIDPAYRDWDTVDWARTRAYASGLFGNLFVNLRGREPEGLVEPGREYELLRDELSENFSRITLPDSRPLVSEAFRREEIYWGPALERAPDLLFVFRDYEYMTRGATEFLGDTLIGPVAVGHSGNHRSHGVVALCGPRAASGLVGDSEITETAATILYLAGAPIPANLDAGPAERLFDPAALTADPPKSAPPIPECFPLQTGEKPSSMEEVVKRLQGLGYLV